MHISERIKFLISELGYNMNTFSKQIGLTNNVTVGKIINEKRNPSYDVTMKILNRFPEVNTHWFVTGEGDIFDYSKSNERLVEDPNESYGMTDVERRILSIEKKMLSATIELKELKELL